MSRSNERRRLCTGAGSGAHTVDEYRHDAKLRELSLRIAPRTRRSRKASPDCINAREAERLEGVGSLRKLAPLRFETHRTRLTLSRIEVKGLDAMGFFATFSAWLNGLLSTYIATNTAHVATLLAPAIVAFATLLRDDLGLFAHHREDRGALRDGRQAHCHAWRSC